MSTTRMHVLYALMALPIAMVGLPIYLQMPQFYAEQTGLGLGMLGAILFFTRLIDTVQDPLIGTLSERFLVRGVRREIQMLYALPVFLLALLALCMPTAWPALSLTLSLIVLYTAFSILSVNYYAMGTQLGQGVAVQTRLSSWREGITIIGILLGSVVPQMLQQNLSAALSYLWFSLIVILISLVFLPLSLRFFTRTTMALPHAATPGIWQAMRAVWGDFSARQLMLLYGGNSIANAIPATLILFYVADSLQAKAHMGYFLGIYFLAAILAVPLWNIVAKRAGPMRAWFYSVVLAALAFLPAAFLTPEHAPLFYVVCLLSGACLGADMAMPAAILSSHVQSENKPAGHYFGAYHLLYKLALAVAAGIALPTLEALGYIPGTSDYAAELAYAYALIPALLKLLVALWLWRVIHSVSGATS